MVLKKFGGRKFLSFSNYRLSSTSDVLATARILKEQLKDLEAKCEEHKEMCDEQTERADTLEEELALLKNRLQWQTEVTTRMETTLGVSERQNEVRNDMDESWVSAVEEEQGEEDAGGGEEESQPPFTCRDQCLEEGEILQNAPLPKPIVEEGEILSDIIPTTSDTITSLNVAVSKPITDEVLPGNAFSPAVHNRTVSAPIYSIPSAAVSCSASYHNESPSNYFPQGRIQPANVLGPHNTIRTWEATNPNRRSHEHIKPAPYRVPNLQKASGHHWRKSLAANWRGDGENRYENGSRNTQQGYMKPSASSFFNFTPEPYMEWSIPGPVRSTHFF